MVLSRGSRQPERRQPERLNRLRDGFSVIEVLIALSILALTLVGILPLFTKSMANNVEGNQLTEVTNRSRRHVEWLMSLPFDHFLLAVPEGDAALEVTEKFSSAQDRWLEEASFPADEVALYTRQTRVRQFSVTAISDTDLVLTDIEAVDGTIPPTPPEVHFKEIEVRVNTGAPSTQNLMGTRKTVTLRVLKSR